MRGVRGCPACFLLHFTEQNLFILGQIMSKRQMDQEALGLQSTWNKGHERKYKGKGGKFSPMI